MNKLQVGLIAVFLVAGILFLLYSAGLLTIYQTNNLRVGVGPKFLQFTGGSGTIGEYVVSVDSGYPSYDANGKSVQFSDSYVGTLYYGGVHMVVTKNGQKVYETPCVTAGCYRNGMSFTFSSELFNATVSGGGSSIYGQGQGGTYATAAIVPNTSWFKDRVNITVTSAQKGYFKGENATVKVFVTNDALDNMQFVGTVHVCTPVFSDQSFCQDYKQDVLLKKGVVNTITLSLPTDRVTDQLDVSISYNIYYPTDYFKDGVYANCGGTCEDSNKITSSDKIDVFGTVTQNKQTFMVIPRPLVIDLNCQSSACPAGYTCKQIEAGTFKCLSNEVLNLQLSCLVLGCPVVPGAFYSCTSSGVCAETIYQTVIQKQDCTSFGCPEPMKCLKDTASDNSYCMLNTTTTVNQDCRIIGCAEGQTCLTDSSNNYYCLKTETQQIDCKTTGCGPGMLCVTNNTDVPYCLRSEFVNVLRQCFKPSDCATPCTGVTVNCVDNQCDYSGSCSSQFVGCGQLGCGEGYTCNDDRGVCERIIVGQIFNDILLPGVMILAIALGIILVVIYKRR